MKVMDSASVVDIICQTLNHVDMRLVDHGRRVAFLGVQMLKQHGGYDGKELRRLAYLMLLHDIGAYKTEEIDNMVQFETAQVWEHSVYGHLFIKYLTPLPDYAQVILFHHLDADILCSLEGVDRELKFLSQIVYLADRTDIYLQHMGAKDAVVNMRKQRPGRFMPQVLDLLEAVQREHGALDKLENGEYYGEIVDFLSEADFGEEEILEYLKMVVYAIDFRSTHTVNHTITTTSISRELARIMGLSRNAQKAVWQGALVHDLGKIGIPVEILEFPGKLSPQAMRVMKTHVDITEEILGKNLEQKILRIAIRHHEKLDGSGYPRGLAGEELTVEERIVAIADIVSALSGTRSYKPAFAREKIISILEEMKEEGKICPTVTQILISHYGKIMDTVQRNCEPVLQAYAQMHREYHAILERYRQLTPQEQC